MELIGGIEETLAAMSQVLHAEKLAAPADTILAEIAREREQMMRHDATLSGVPIHPLRLVAELQDILTPDVTVCSDVGSFSIYLSRYLYSFRARQVLISNGQQTLGVALPWGIAATLVRPHEKVLSISGDGGFLFSANELETAVRLKSHLVHMIWIDGTYDMVAVQERLKCNRESGIGFGPVDPVKYAEAFGATGLRIESPEQIGPTLRKAFDTPGPCVGGRARGLSRQPQVIREGLREQSGIATEFFGHRLGACDRPMRSMQVIGLRMWPAGPSGYHVARSGRSACTWTMRAVCCGTSGSGIRPPSRRPRPESPRIPEDWAGYGIRMIGLRMWPARPSRCHVARSAQYTRPARRAPGLCQQCTVRAAEFG
ncbi:MAG: thiamine pyrophosphate-dependent enzyme [Ignavibacteriota bacterium]